LFLSVERSWQIYFISGSKLYVPFRTMMQFSLYAVKLSKDIGWRRRLKAGKTKMLQMHTCLNLKNFTLSFVIFEINATHKMRLEMMSALWYFIYPSACLLKVERRRRRILRRQCVTNLLTGRSSNWRTLLWGAPWSVLLEQPSNVNLSLLHCSRRQTVFA
jgi:hypothetical protein